MPVLTVKQARIVLSIDQARSIGELAEQAEAAGAIALVLEETTVETTVAVSAKRVPTVLIQHDGRAIVIGPLRE